MRDTLLGATMKTPWRIHASVLMDWSSWVIKNITGEHTSCQRLEENPMMSSDWLYMHLLGDLQAYLDCPIESLQKLCLDKYIG